MNLAGVRPPSGPGGPAALARPEATPVPATPTPAAQAAAWADALTAIALLEHRVCFLEKIVYGLCGTILLAVLGGICALVIRAQP